MIDKGTIHTSAEQAIPLIIGYDTVYVHTDIQKTEDDDGNTVYTCNEVQYGKDEYIKLQAETTEALSAQVTTQNTQLQYTNLAIAALYES